MAMQGYALGNDATAVTILKMDTLNIDGNIIPHTWYDHFRYPSGKPNLNAIVILSEIVYWYRPIHLKDERTGRPLPPRKKFEGVYLQRTRKSFADQFGLTPKQARDALDFLEDKGVIKVIVKKSLIIKEGKKLGNVPYIVLNADKIAEVNLPSDFTGPTNTETTVTETLYTENTQTYPHHEKSNVDFSGGFSSDNPQQPTLLPPSDVVTSALNGNGNGNQHEKAKGKPGRPAKEAHPNTKPIMDAYIQALGRNPANYAKESAAAKKMAEEGYSPAQVAAVYRTMKASAFYSDKFLSLAKVHEQIGEVYKPSRGDSSVSSAENENDSRQGTTKKPNYLTFENTYT